MSGRLPIRRIVFYRHGVAYVEREGEAEGTVTLEVREGDMSDVLKSLALSGPVRSVSFETPEDPGVLAARRGMDGLFDSPLRALFKRLRGSRVVLDTAAGSRLEGVLVGFETRTDSEGHESERVVLHAGARLIVVDVADVRAVTGDDNDLDQELGALLAHVRGQDRGEARKLVLDLERPGHVRCGYVVPASPWRVAYRVTLEGGAEAGSGAEQLGQLTAHALLHNPTDESIEGAQAVLTTGEPQSFSLELHRPTLVRRAIVQETQRGGRSPVMYQREMAKKAMPSPPAAPRRAMSAVGAASFGGGGPGAMAMADASFDEGFGSGADGAEGSERGELFEYSLTEPLDLARGRSAMVPLVSRSVRIAKERVYRADRGKHPDLVLGFTNDTGVVLEEGAAVLYEQHDYAGEAMLPLTGKGSRVRLAYGTDQAISCTVHETHHEIMVGLTLVQGDFVEQRRQERHVTLTVVSERDDEVEILFELGKRHGFVPMVGFPEAKEETLEARRYACRAPARSSASLQLQESAVYAVHIDADSVSPRILEWAKASPLEGSHGIWQAKLLELVHARAALATRLRLEEEARHAVTEKRQEIAGELSSIGSQTPEEMRVRTKLAGALEQLYERSRAQDERIDALQAEIAAATLAMADHVRG